MFIHLDQSAKEEVDSGEKIGESHDVATRGMSRRQKFAACAM